MAGFVESSKVSRRADLSPLLNSSFRSSFSLLSDELLSSNDLLSSTLALSSSPCLAKIHICGTAMSVYRPSGRTGVKLHNYTATQQRQFPQGATHR